jgi:hypothetical protein
VTTPFVDTAIPPPSIGQAFSFHVPSPSFRGGENRSPPLDFVKYISRDPLT